MFSCKKAIYRYHISDVICASLHVHAIIGKMLVWKGFFAYPSRLSRLIIIVTTSALLNAEKTHLCTKRDFIIMMEMEDTSMTFRCFMERKKRETVIAMLWLILLCSWQKRANWWRPSLTRTNFSITFSLLSIYIPRNCLIYVTFIVCCLVEPRVYYHSSDKAPRQSHNIASSSRAKQN